MESNERRLAASEQEDTASEYGCCGVVCRDGERADTPERGRSPGKHLVGRAGGGQAAERRDPPVGQRDDGDAGGRRRQVADDSHAQL